MSIDADFKTAAKAQKFSGWVFYSVIAASAVLVFVTDPQIEAILHPVLIAAAALAIGLTTITTIYQVRGNRQLRAVQLSDALDARIGTQAAHGYYNSPLPPSIARLASTVLENTFFSSAVLQRMMLRERIKSSVYLVLFAFLLASRWTSTGFLLLIAQTLFSADVILSWIRGERFLHRTNDVRQRLTDFFLHGASAVTANQLAIALAAFTDYECAKDEAVIPLDSEIFDEMNTSLSSAWEKEKLRLGIKV